MKLAELSQPGRGDAADYFGETEKNYGTTKLKVAAVVLPQMADDAAPSESTTVGKPMETLDSIPGKWQLLQLTFRPGSSHMRLGSGIPQIHKCIKSLLSDAAAD